MAKQFIIFLTVINLIYGQQKHITQSNPCEEAAIDAKNDVEKWLWIEKTNQMTGLLNTPIVIKKKYRIWEIYIHG